MPTEDSYARSLLRDLAIKELRSGWTGPVRFLTLRPFAEHQYAGVEGVTKLAASYAAGIVRNHPFVDGNERVALVALALFPALNGKRLRADQADAFREIYRLAAGEINEEELGLWVQQNSVEAV